MSYKIEQKKLYDQLLDVRKQTGDLTPENVVDVAADPAHPLHSRFEWDDTVAGERWRISQAGELIRRVKIVYTDEPEREPRKARAFFSSAYAKPDAPKGSYSPTTEIMENPVHRRMLLAQCKRELDDFTRKYGHLVEFADLLAAAAKAAKV